MTNLEKRRIRELGQRLEQARAHYKATADLWTRLKTHRAKLEREIERLGRELEDLKQGQLVFDRVS